MKETGKGKKQFKNSTALVIYFLKGSTGFFLLSMVFASAVSFLDMVLPGMIKKAAGPDRSICHRCCAGRGGLSFSVPLFQ